MLPWIVVDTCPDGTLALARRGSEWEVRAGRLTLMSSRMHGSEEALCRLAFDAAPGARAVLLGGLGLGFSLREALRHLPADGRIVVAELSPALVRWNREHVGELAGHPLRDTRVELALGDVFLRLTEAAARYDAIVLDVDNGPEAFSQRGNDRLYDDDGVRLCRRALRPGGVLSVWSAGPDERYLLRLRRGGFDAESKPVAARSGGRKRHVVFVAVRPSGGGAVTRVLPPRGNRGALRRPRPRPSFR